MRAVEAKVAKLLDDHKKANDRFYRRITAAVEQLTKAGRSHPKKYVEMYRWEYDDGYGFQKKNTGIRCRLCGLEEDWPSSYGGGFKHVWYGRKLYKGPTGE